MEKRMGHYDVIRSINKGVDLKSIVFELEESYDIQNHLNIIASEAKEIIELRNSMIPLFEERMNVNMGIQNVLTGIEMEVMLQFPPRQGSEAQRTSLRNKLQNENEEYVALKKELDTIDQEVASKNNRINFVETSAKNARRILETFNHMIKVVLELQK